MRPMQRMPLLPLLSGLILTCVAASSWAADDFSATATKLKAAMSDAGRTSAETERDDNRKPLETLEFFQLRDDMKVLEILPGGGWYTKLLGPTLEAKGKLYIAIGAERTGEALKDKPGFGSLEVIPFDRSNFVRKDGEKRTTVPEFSFGVKRLDMALTFRNMHNFTKEGRANINKAVFEALKSGGIYGVVDHTRRHMQVSNDEIWRRMDPVTVIKEVEAAGFKFVDFSPLHFRPDDELRYEVGRKTVTGNTDRFTLLFKKP
jgi:predicted methyltransferase